MELQAEADRLRLQLERRSDELADREADLEAATARAGALADAVARKEESCRTLEAMHEEKVAEIADLVAEITGMCLPL